MIAGGTADVFIWVTSLRSAQLICWPSDDLDMWGFVDHGASNFALSLF